MSCLHLRSASTTLFERLHRTIVVLSGAFRPVAQRARRTLSDRIATMWQTFRQFTSHLRRR
ncbi:hypothetical protein LMG28688_06566 [Paraburkholderia caffeinitolerans]|uniref:Uncharacterized protein n=1 Tax=Paraburkholderia caffeinitolerans TaxID=1723730 RepID=A0A6J5GYB9_9BURK|nr:hypothetical protein [Paraburkholderia caffeinitolerans]CAB3807536.1 hypothetical protein LMG28688_06566 [Paraburkholderia caffeinitolerans]